jgi:glycosyltransferase involved in cell wall biosynthesis
MRIALIGTRGVPAAYGGFETCVEQVGQRLVKLGHEVTVYCRSGNGEHGDGPDEHLGMRLVHLPALRRKSLETLSHTALSVLHVLKQPTDAVVVFNGANSVFLPALRARRVPVATHVDGLEWRRAKWQGAGRAYYRLAESLAVRWSDALIADAPGIADYYAAEFDAHSDLIAYGAPILLDDLTDKLAEAGLRRRGYHLVVARFEPENHVDVIVEGYCRSTAQLPLVVVGTAPYADQYTKRVRALADDRVRFLGGVWDQNLLDQLYANALTYLHGHSVGGTNPSLLRAIGAAAPVIAYDVAFNRSVSGDAGDYFSDAAGVAEKVESAEADSDGTIRRGLLGRRIAESYDWDEVAARYEQLCERLASNGPLRRSERKSGRRNGIDVDRLLGHVPPAPRSS